MESEDLVDISFDLFLDDDDKKEVAKKEKQFDTFSPNYREYEWFRKSSSTDELQVAQMAKFKADLLYYKGNYDEALSEYERCVSLISKTNNTLRRDVKESIGWTLLKINHNKEKCDTTTSSSYLDSDCQETSDNSTSWHFLASQHLSHDYESWQRLASLHPHNDYCWMQLAASFQQSSLSAHSAVSYAYALNFARRHIFSSTSFSQSRHRTITFEAAEKLAKLVPHQADRGSLTQEVYSITDEIVEYKDLSKFVEKYFPLWLQKMAEKMTMPETN